MSWIAAHRKLLAYAAGIALTVAVHVWGTGNPYVAAALLVATGLGVHQVPNEFPGPDGRSRTPAPAVQAGAGAAIPPGAPAPPAPASQVPRADPPSTIPGREAGAGPL